VWQRTVTRKVIPLIVIGVAVIGPSFFPTSYLVFFVLEFLIGVAAITFLVYCTQIYADAQGMRDLVFLQVLTPKKESKTDKETDTEQYSTGRTFKDVVAIMDHLFNSLYGIHDTHKIRRFFFGQPFFSVEYAALEGEILFYFVVPRKLLSLIEKQITSFYPDAVIDEVEDYNIFTKQSYTASTYLMPMMDVHKPLKTYETIKSDPQNAITNAFSKLAKDEGAAVQFMLRPHQSGWQKKARKEARKLLNPRKEKISWWNPVSWASAMFDGFTQGASKYKLESGEERTGGERVSQVTEELSKIMDMKASSPGYHSLIRVVTSASTQRKADQQLENVIGAFIQFNDINGNLLRRTRIHNHRKLIESFIRRFPRRSIFQVFRWKKLILSSGEIGSLFHLPNILYNKVPMIKWQNYKVVAAPKNIPDSHEEGSVKLGINSYRGIKRDVYLKATDRFRHFYVIGQTGTGKSSMITTMAQQDFLMGNGCCIVDPHGSLAEELLGRIPRERADDIIYFNPADTERPMGMNLLEGKTEEERDLIALDAMNMMVKMFGEEIFGPRIQDYFRNGCLTLMADEDEGGAITDLVRLFTDDEWQQYKVSKISNPIVKSFWQKQMAQTGQREKQEMIPYFAAKFGQFTTNTLIRNIVGQVKSAFDFAECMANKKIIIMNLSKGLTGDINSQLLGMITVSKIQVAAMRRQKVSADERVPFFLYIDEFQNYVTQSIESILSEARKYKLGLILAHQYLDQLEKESKLAGAVKLKGAIFGNIGTMMFYKIGAQDAEYCAKEMAPKYSEQDLINLDKYKAVIKLSVDTQPSPPFSIIPDNPYLEKPDEEAAEAYKQLSRLTYGRDKQFVSREIERRIGANLPPPMPPGAMPPPPPQAPPPPPPMPPAA
jgi:hypothetical protein